MTTAEDTRTSLRRRTVLAAAVAVLGLAGAERAAAAAPMLVDLQVVDRETGRVARVWRHAGRLYVAGQPGARYGLRVTNNTPGRVLVVMSVDGVNIVTGETAGYGQSGYVLAPHQSYDMDGWRKSDTEIAAFTFAPLPQSYAARTGRPNDVGVIGVAAFTERKAQPAPAIASAPRSRRSSRQAEEVVVTQRRAAPPLDIPAPPPPSALGAVAAEAAPRAEKLGTGHGARERSVVTSIAFERASPNPQFIRRIEYDTHDNLVAGGVIPRPRPVQPRPQPFPASPGPNGYVPDPR